MAKPDPLNDAARDVVDRARGLEGAVNELKRLVRQGPVGRLIAIGALLGFAWWQLQGRTAGPWEHLSTAVLILAAMSLIAAFVIAVIAPPEAPPPQSIIRLFSPYNASDAGVFRGLIGLQQRAWIDAIASTRPVVVVQGPEGSGKTSLILAGVVPHMSEGSQAPTIVYASLDSDGTMQQVYEAIRKHAMDSTEDADAMPTVLDAMRVALEGDRDLMLIVDHLERAREAIAAQLMELAGLAKTFQHFRLRFVTRTSHFDGMADVLIERGIGTSVATVVMVDHLTVDQAEHTCSALAGAMRWPYEKRYVANVVLPKLSDPKTGRIAPTEIQLLASTFQHAGVGGFTRRGFRRLGIDASVGVDLLYVRRVLQEAVKGSLREPCLAVLATLAAAHEALPEGLRERELANRLGIPLTTNHLRETLAVLGDPAVRLVASDGNPSDPTYRLYNERIGPAVRALASGDSTPARARALLLSRLREWHLYRRGTGLSWREYRAIRRNIAATSLGALGPSAVAFMQRAKIVFRVQAAAVALALAASGAVGYLLVQSRAADADAVRRAQALLLANTLSRIAILEELPTVAAALAVEAHLATPTDLLDDQLVVLASALERQPRLRSTLHFADASSVAIGERLLVLSRDGAIDEIGVDGRQVRRLVQLQEPGVRTGTPNRIAVSPDSQTIVVLLHPDRLAIVHRQVGSVTYVEHTAADVRFSRSNSDTFYTFATSGVVEWSVAASRPLNEVPRLVFADPSIACRNTPADEVCRVSAVAFSHTSTLEWIAVSGTSSGRLAFQTSEGHLVGPVDSGLAAVDEVFVIEVGGDSDRAGEYIVATTDRQLAWWHLESGDVSGVTSLDSHFRVAHLAASPDGRFLAVMGSDGTIELIETSTRRRAASWKAHFAGVGVGFFPDSLHLYTFGASDDWREGGAIRIWNVSGLASWEPAWSFANDDADHAEVAGNGLLMEVVDAGQSLVPPTINPQESMVAVVDAGGTIRVTLLPDGPHTAWDPRHAIAGMKFLEHGGTSYLLTVGVSGDVALWPISEYGVLTNVRPETSISLRENGRIGSNVVASVATCSDVSGKTMVIVGESSGLAAAWMLDLASSRPTEHLWDVNHDVPITALALTPSCSGLAVAVREELLLYDSPSRSGDCEDGCRRVAMRDHIVALGFTSAEQLLAVSLHGAVLGLPRNGEHPEPLLSESTSLVPSAAFDREGRFVLLGSTRGRQLVSTATGRVVATWPGERHLAAVTLSGSGSVAAAASAGSAAEASTWAIGVDPWVSRLCRMAGRALNDREWALLRVDALLGPVGEHRSRLERAGCRTLWGS